MKESDNILRLLSIGCVVITWLAGVALAKGFWSTLLAVCCPFWAWYLVVERSLVFIGWIGI
jgi:hypothetical protein